MIGTKVIVAGGIAVVSVVGNVIQGLKIRSLKAGEKTETANTPKKRKFWQKKIVVTTSESIEPTDEEMATQIDVTEVDLPKKNILVRTFGRLFRKASPVPA